jgi:hypothetical protein
MKVLLLGTSTTEPDYAAWKGALEREGVPFESIITSPGHTPIGAATLSNGNEGKYQAIIVSVAGLPECTATCVSTLSSSEWTAVESYEQTFNVRQISGDVFPSSTYGLTSPTVTGALDGTQGAVTTEGTTVFPYLNGPVAMDVGTYGYEATPLSTQAAGASFQTLVSGPGSSSLVGIYTHPNGVQELIETFNENQFQFQAELLRHGAINWVTRGVYFGDQRDYLETNIDDNFLPDDSWSVATHVNDYNPKDALRETPVDVEAAAKWSQENNFRIDMLFNGGGSVAYQGEHAGTDPLLAAFQKDKGSFGWVNHTWDHPNIDIGCASQTYIEAELNQNNIWAAQAPGATAGTGGLGLTASASPGTSSGNNNPTVVVTGEHSGLANLLPGNPGVVDPPSLDSAQENVGGTLPTGQYVYAVTDDFTPGGGQSIASVSSPVTITGPSGSVTLTWGAVCHAAEFKIYREQVGTSEWRLVGTVAAPTTEPPNAWFANPLSNKEVTEGGAKALTFTDTGAAGTASAGPPAANEAAESPYPQNPALIPAFEGVGIKFFGSDASKAYPNPALPGSTTPAFAAGSTFVDGAGQAIPRYPTNIYYNVSTEAQELDEYNTLYLPESKGGKCKPSETTTCEETPANFAQIVASVDSNMFLHMMGNDPRPHYFHQTNMMGTPPPGEPTTGTPPSTSPAVGDGLYYSVMNQLLAEYRKYFKTPLEQPTGSAIGNLLGEQAAWKNALANGQVTGYIEGSQVTLKNGGTTAISVPLTGVPSVGSPYGGIQSGWTSLPPSTSTVTGSTSWPGPPTVTTNPVSQTVTAGESATFTAAASGAPAPTVQWQVSTNGGATFTNDTTDAGNATGTLTVAATTVTESGYEYRAVFKSTAGEATSTAAKLTVEAPGPPPVVTSVSPSSGAAGGIVFVVGQNLSKASAVTFGSQPASFTTVSNTEIAVIAPLFESEPGTVNVTVTRSGQTSAASEADQFTYRHVGA